MSMEHFKGDYYTPVCDVCGKQLRGDYYSSVAINLINDEEWGRDYFMMDEICDDCQEEGQ